MKVLSMKLGCAVPTYMIALAFHESFFSSKCSLLTDLLKFLSQKLLAIKRGINFLQ